MYKLLVYISLKSSCRPFIFGNPSDELISGLADTERINNRVQCVLGSWHRGVGPGPACLPEANSGPGPAVLTLEQLQKCYHFHVWVWHVISHSPLSPGLVPGNSGQKGSGDKMYRAEQLVRPAWLESTSVEKSRNSSPGCHSPVSHPGGGFQERTRHGGSGHPESPEREEGQSSACLSLGRGRSCLHPLCPVLHPGIRLILMALDLASSPRYVKAAPAAARAQAWAGGSCSSSQEGETGLARVAGAGSPRPLTSCSSRVWVPGGGREAGQEPWARPSAGVCEPASQIPGSIPTWLYCASVGRPWQCLVPPCLSFPI